MATMATEETVVVLALAVASLPVELIVGNFAGVKEVQAVLEK